MGLNQHPNNTDLMLLKSEPSFLILTMKKPRNTNYLEEIDPENREVYFKKLLFILKIIIVKKL